MSRALTNDVALTNKSVPPLTLCHHGCPVCSRTPRSLSPRCPCFGVSCVSSAGVAGIPTKLHGTVEPAAGAGGGLDKRCASVLAYPQTRDALYSLLSARCVCQDARRLLATQELSLLGGFGGDAPPGRVGGSAGIKSLEAGSSSLEGSIANPARRSSVSRRLASPPPLLVEIVRPARVADQRAAPAWGAEAEARRVPPARRAPVKAAAPVRRAGPVSSRAVPQSGPVYRYPWSTHPEPTPAPAPAPVPAPAPAPMPAPAPAPVPQPARWYGKYMPAQRMPARSAPATRAAAAPPVTQTVQTRTELIPLPLSSLERLTLSAASTPAAAPAPVPGPAPAPAPGPDGAAVMPAAGAAPVWPIGMAAPPAPPVLPAGQLAPPTVAMLNVGDSLSAALADLTVGAREGSGARSSSSDAEAGHAAPTGTAPAKSAATTSHARSSSTRRKPPPPPPQDEAIPKRNGAMGLYPLRSGLAQEGDANPEMGYYGGSA